MKSSFPKSLETVNIVDALQRGSPSETISQVGIVELQICIFHRKTPSPAIRKIRRHAPRLGPRESVRQPSPKAKKRKDIFTYSRQLSAGLPPKQDCTSGEKTGRQQISFKRALQAGPPGRRYSNVGREITPEGRETPLSTPLLLRKEKGQTSHNCAQLLSWLNTFFSPRNERGIFKYHQLFLPNPVPQVIQLPSLRILPRGVGVVPAEPADAPVQQVVCGRIVG